MSSCQSSHRFWCIAGPFAWPRHNIYHTGYGCLSNKDGKPVAQSSAIMPKEFRSVSLPWSCWEKSAPDLLFLVFYLGFIRDHQIISDLLQAMNPATTSLQQLQGSQPRPQDTKVVECSRPWPDLYLIVSNCIYIYIYIIFILIGHIYDMLRDNSQVKARGHWNASCWHSMFKERAPAAAHSLDLTDLLWILLTEAYVAHAHTHGGCMMAALLHTDAS